MKTRLFSVTAVLASCILLCSNQEVSARRPAQGNIVSWADGYPKKISDSDGSGYGTVDVYGTYSEQAGWKAQTIVVYFAPKGGGEPTGIAQDFTGGKWGKLQNGAIGPYRLSVAKGSWNVWVTGTFKETATGNTQGIVGDFYVVTIN